MISHAREKRFMMFWNFWRTGSCSMRRMVCGEKGIEKAMKFPLAYETDVANFYGRVSFARVRLP